MGDTPALLGVGLLVVAAAVLVLLGALENHYRFNDELYVVFGSRIVDAQFPGGLLDADAYGGRGPERLTGWLLGLTNVLSGSTAGDLRNGHIAVAIAWALTALPAWALGRGVGLGRWAALVPAALVAAGVWSYYGITVLNTTLGLLTFCVQLWVMHRVLVAPSRRWELALVLAVLAVLLARVGHAPFVLALAPALLVQAWRDRPEGAARGAWLVRLVPHVVRTWPILTVVALAALAALLVLGQDRVLGAYGSGITQQTITAGSLVDQAATMLGRTALAMAIVPVVLGGWWLLAQAVAPDDRGTGAFALLGLGTVAIEVYVFYTAVIEDRYLVPLLPVAAVAGSAALLRHRSRLSVVGVAAVALVVGWAAWEHGRDATGGAFATFIAPGARFFEQVLGGRLSTLLPVSVATLTFALVVLCLLIAIAVAVARRDGRAPWVGTVVALGLVAFGVAGGQWAQARFVEDVGEADASWAQIAWVDEAVGPDARIGLLADDAGATQDPLLIADFTDRYFRLSGANASIRVSVGTNGTTRFACCPPLPLPGGMLSTDAQTGSVGTEGVVPRMLAVPTGFRPFGLNTTWLGSGAGGFSLQRSDRPLALGWVAEETGRYADGWSRPGQALGRRTFPALTPGGPGGRRCWVAALSAPILDDPVRVRVTGGARPVEVELGPGATRGVRVVLPRSSRPVTLRVAPERAGELADGRRAGVLATDDRVGAC